MSAADKIAWARDVLDGRKWRSDEKGLRNIVSALADIAEAQAKEIAKLKGIIALMDKNSARVVRDFYDPGVTLSEWAQSQYPELRLSPTPETAQ